jgi:hypothetical protein
MVKVDLRKMNWMRGDELEFGIDNEFIKVSKLLPIMH